jgi:CHAT domain-containing protein/tetratricopeptide (TPR) repeat protein
MSQGAWRPLFIVFLAALIMLTPGARAQQPPKELQELRETSHAFYRAGDYALALQFAERVLPLVIRTYGPDHEQTGLQYYSLGLTAEKAGNLAAAQRHYTETVRVREKVYGVQGPSVAEALEALGAVHIKLGRPDAAEPIFQRALKLKQDLIGFSHAYQASGHANLGDVALARGNWPAALASYRQSIGLLTGQDTSQTMAKAIVDDEIRRYRDTFVGLCRAAWQTREQPATNRAALLDETFQAGQQAWTTSAGSALAKMTARIGAGDTDLGRSIRRVQDLSERILRLNADDQQLLTGWSAVQRADPAYSAALEEFRAASAANARDPATIRQRDLARQFQDSLQRCPPSEKKARCETSEADRAAMAKELGELSRAIGAGAGAIMAVHRRMEAAEKALPGYADFQARRTALRNDIDRADTEVRDARAQIIRAFPAYVALADPKPLRVADAQALLRSDEALVAILVGSAKSFVWALTRERAEWAEIDAGTQVLSEQVAALRNGLDPLAQQDAEGAPGSRPGVIGRFDLGRAHALYRLVLGPVAGVVAGKRHLIVVPTGPLTSLPLQVLLTAPPPGPNVPPAQALLEASWLIKAHALSVLPSVPSLRALRTLAGGTAATRPFFGMGDPVLEGPRPDRQRGAKQRSAAAPARFYRNGLADIRAVRELTPLPDTARELETIAKALGAPPDAVNLREAASEAKVKSAPLNQYRIVQFATHGLVAGDLSGLAEPALVLTPPEAPTEANDGLLTASEIATLKLDADWVVLSACNTAAGGGEGAEALSGLARAFFYAGARALLVSHWAVYSTAATELTTKTFATLAASPGLGRAEAFRRAMLDLIAEGKEPAYWAPFVVVGEGGASGVGAGGVRP